MDVHLSILAAVERTESVVGLATGNRSFPSLKLENEMANSCMHLAQIKVVNTDKDYCEDCIQTGDSWVHLRMCLTCGHVACCDSSPNRHASKHFRKSGHPLIRSLEAGETWTWCYVDEVAPGDLAS